MTTAGWHADPELLARYARGAIDDARAYSLEAHLLACPRCRLRLARRADWDRLGRVWGGIRERLEPVSPGPVERTLLRLGVPDHLARLLAATRSLRLSWFAAVAFALAFAAGAARAGAGGVLLFLVVAPLVPLAGVAVAYGPGVDPTYEVGVASPFRSLRLLLVRAVAVLATSTALAGLAALALPGLGWTAIAWLLPSLGLAGASLALSTFWPPVRAAGAVAGAWVGAVVLAEGLSPTPLAAFRPAGQAGVALLLLLSVAVLAARAEALETRRSR